MARVRANEPFIEDAAREQVEFFFFYSAQKTNADFGGLRHFIQRDVAFLAFAFQPRAEGSHVPFSCQLFVGPIFEDVLKYYAWMAQSERGFHPLISPESSFT